MFLFLLMGIHFYAIISKSHKILSLYSSVYFVIGPVLPGVEICRRFYAEQV